MEDNFVTEALLLSQDVGFRSGFECGAVYILMSQRVPLICGAYHSQSQEQLFLLAHKFGYTFEWEAHQELLLVSFKLSDLAHE